MPQVSAAALRSKPSSTSASASIRRAAALFFSPLAALRSSDAVRSSRVIDTAAPIDAAPLKSQHRVRVSLIWESLMSHSFGPLVLNLCRLSAPNRWACSIRKISELNPKSLLRGFDDRGIGRGAENHVGG